MPDVMGLLPRECVVSEKAFENCPRCGSVLEAGFAHKAIGLSFVAPDNLERFIWMDEDLARSGLRKLLPSWAEYFRSYLCRSCDLYLVDYSATMDHAQAKQIALSMTGGGETGNHASPDAMPNR
jgi:hypothetical protein